MKTSGWRVTVLATLVLAWPQAQATRARMQASAPTLRVSLDHPSPALWRFLRHDFLPDSGLTGPFPATWGHVAVVRLPHRHTDLIVVQVTQGGCGSGGCSLEVYESARGGGPPFRNQGDVSFSHPPIRLLPTTHHGLPDIVLNTKYVQPISPAADLVIPVVVPFDGRYYPEKPVVPPARPAKKWERRGGTLLIPDYPLDDRRPYGLVLTPAVPAPVEEK